MPDHYITYVDKKGIENLLTSLYNYSQDKLVFIDNSFFPWLINYLRAVKDVKKISPELTDKANATYKGLDELLTQHGYNPSFGCNGTIHIPKETGSELCKSAKITTDTIDEKLKDFNKLYEHTQKRWRDIKTYLTTMREHMQSLMEYAKHLQGQTTDPIAEEIADMLNCLKPHFKWGIKGGNKDIHLVAAAFSKALTTQREAYIITEDEDIKNVAHCLYSLFACSNTGLQPLFNDYTAKVTVLKAEYEAEFTKIFDYKKIPIGKEYSIESQLTGSFQPGLTFKESKNDALDRALKRINRTKPILKMMLSAEKKKTAAAAKPAPTPEPKKPEKISGPDAIPVLAEAASLRMEAERLEESTDFPNPAFETAPQEPQPVSPEINAIAERALAEGAPQDPAKIAETLRAIAEQKLKEELAAAPPVQTAPAVKSPEPLYNTFQIVRDYARQAYEKPEETPEKQKAMSALEELAKTGSKEISDEITSLLEKDINHKLGTAITELEKIKTQIKNMVATENWEEKPEFAQLNLALIEALQKKKELQTKLGK